MKARRPAHAFPSIETLGEDALLLRFGDTIDATVNARVHALARRIGQRRPAWLRDLVPGYASLALFVDARAFAADADALAEAQHWLEAAEFAPVGSTLRDAGPAQGPLVEIPVHYGGEAGPDLPAVAEHAGLSMDAVIERHAAVEYQVAMLGFAPGFPYLIGLDPRLAMPRLETPRTRIPAGSVGIGGAQAGVYPHAGPGGWRIIGRTPLALFDAQGDPPAMLAPGDRVRFVPIDARSR